MVQIWKHSSPVRHRDRRMDSFFRGTSQQNRQLGYHKAVSREGAPIQRLMQSGTPNYKALVSRAAQPCWWDELGMGLLETRRVLLESRLWVSFTALGGEEAAEASAAAAAAGGGGGGGPTGGAGVAVELRPAPLRPGSAALLPRPPTAPPPAPSARLRPLPRSAPRLQPAPPAGPPAPSAPL